MSRSLVQAILCLVSAFAGSISFLWIDSASGQESSFSAPAKAVPRAASSRFDSLDTSLEIYRDLDREPLATNFQTNTTGKSNKPVYGAPGSERDPLFGSDLAKPTELEVLELALERGDARSLQVLREEVLENKSNYRSDILPALESMVLAEILLRFRSQDWKEWAEIGVAGGAEMTPARSFVENISGVNTELGIFADTAGHLMHRLYLRTESGSSFDLKLELQDLINNADSLVGVRANSYVPAAYLFSPSIISNQSFISALESKRCQFFAKFVEARPDWVEKQINLLGELEVRRCDPVVESKVAGIINRVSRNGSKSLRQNLFRDAELITKLRAYAKTSDVIKKRMASLYSARSIDYLEAGSFEEAKVNLRTAEKLYPGQELYKGVRSYIRASLAQPAEPEVMIGKVSEQQGTSGSLSEDEEVVEVEQDFVANDYQDSEQEFVDDHDQSSEFVEEDEFLGEASVGGGWVFTAMVWVILITFLAGIVLFFVKRMAESRLSGTSEFSDSKSPAGFEDEDFWDQDSEEPEVSEFEADLDEVNDF